MLVFSNERRWPAASHPTPQAKSYYRISYISRLPTRNVNCLSPLTSILIVWKAPLGPWFTPGAFFFCAAPMSISAFATDRKILVFERLAFARRGGSCSVRLDRGVRNYLRRADTPG